MGKPWDFGGLGLWTYGLSQDGDQRQCGGVPR